MINVDFSFAIALYIALVIVILLGLWLFDRKQKDGSYQLDSRFVWYCSVCSYTYINTRDEIISACPRCASFNKK